MPRLTRINNVSVCPSLDNLYDGKEAGPIVIESAFCVRNTIRGEKYSFALNLCRYRDVMCS